VASSGCTRRFTDKITDSGRPDLSNSLLLKQQNLEAEVGIGLDYPAVALQICLISLGNQPKSS
jgi:hypothetical protein